MPKRNIIVIGGSSGSFEVFKTIAAGLPKDLDVSIFIVWHMSPDVRGILPQVLNSVGNLPASEARDGERIESGRIYVARPDHHLVVENDSVRVTRGPKENRFRPAIDPLFRSAAYTYGERVIGVITSGALDDGTSGLWTIKHRRGLAMVQDPSDAEIPSMPESAIREVDVDHVVPAADLPRLLIRRSQEDVPDVEEGIMEQEDNRRMLEVKIAAEDNALDTGVMQSGELTPFTCPECSGVLSRLKDGDRPRFRCHTGHAFSPDTLLASLTENIEESLWNAVRGVDESIMLLNHLGDHFAEINKGNMAAKFFQKATEARQRNEFIRKVVLEHERLTTESIGQEPDVRESPSEARAA
jgi:two-component system, chemotaxis family, protein-glutamate methylesterase/glutaminase